MSTTSRRSASAVGLVLALVAGCGQAVESDDEPPPASPGAPATARAEAVEVATLDPRIVLSHDEGVMTLDTGTGEVLDDLPLDGFLRLNQAGDGRHVLITTTEGFRVYDSGLEARGHGDHFHYYAADPAVTDVVLPADHGGHVVNHAGRTALFADGTGEVQHFDPLTLADGAPEVETWTAPDPHHGVALELSDHTMVASVGTEDGRTGAVLLDADRQELARSEECPGLHGEATARDEVVVLGCEDGPLLVRHGEFVKVEVGDDYARSGNLAGHPESAVVLGDYKVDPEADLERPERVALIDTADAGVRLVDLGASYTFRSLGRGPDGSALVLATDGTLRVLDAETGEELRRVEVTEPWEEPEDWQEPRPALHVADGVAYVTEPAARQLHAVSIATGDVVRSYDLPHVPNELTSATGFVPAPAEHDH